MPRYHFNVYDGVTELDAEGVHLTDDREAKRQGLKLAASILSQEADSPKHGNDWHLEVTDGRGMIMHRIDLTITDSPAMGHPPFPRLATDRSW